MGGTSTPAPTPAPSTHVTVPGPALPTSQNPTTSPTISLAPTTQNWSVGPALTTVVEADNIFDGLLHVDHTLGISVKQNHTLTELYDYNCINKKNMTGLAMYILPHGGNIGFGSYYSYDIGVNQTLLGDDVGGFVTYTGDAFTGNAAGSARCCIRVSTFESETYDQWTQAFFRETNFILNFNMTDNKIELNNIVVSENDPDSFITRVDDEFKIDVYQCDNFTRVTTPLAIQQDDPIVVCLEPSHPDDLDVVHITNFNLAISGGTINTADYILYDAVTFGTTTWSVNILTNVRIQEKLIMVSAPVIAQFFISGKTSIDVTGNAFFEFDSAKRVVTASAS